MRFACCLPIKLCISPRSLLFFSFILSLYNIVSVLWLINDLSCHLKIFCQHAVLVYKDDFYYTNWEMILNILYFCQNYYQHQVTAISILHEGQNSNKNTNEDFLTQDISSIVSKVYQRHIRGKVYMRQILEQHWNKTHRATLYDITYRLQFYWLFMSTLWNAKMI